MLHWLCPLEMTSEIHTHQAQRCYSIYCYSAFTNVPSTIVSDSTEHNHSILPLNATILDEMQIIPLHLMESLRKKKHCTA